MEERCKHKWIDMEDGTLDQFCMKCSIKQKRNVMALPLSESVVAPITVPILRETMAVHTLVGMMNVYKDDLMKDFKESQGIGINQSLFRR